MNADALAALVRELRESTRLKWERSLPMADHFVDRWEKARWLGWGEGSSVYDSCLIIGDVRVGAHTWVGPFTILDGSGGLEIGDHCSISAGSQIYTHDTVAWSLSGGRDAPERSATRVGSRSYLGPNVVITRGITIGEGCVVGANSLVMDDIPAGMRAWGTPCRVVGPAKADEMGTPADTSP